MTGVASVVVASSLFLGGWRDATRAPLPFAFVENRGQWPRATRFVARDFRGAVLLAPDSIALRTWSVEAGRARFANLRLVFEGANASVLLEGRDEVPGRHHSSVGNDPARWRRDLRGYARVVYEGLYPGVDLVVRKEGGLLEYDLLVSPAVDLDRAVVRVEGAAAPLRLDGEGALVIETALGEVRQPRPTTWREARSAEREALACRYRLLRSDRFGFEVEGRDPALPLVVDPGLLYGTYLGGSGEENFDIYPTQRIAVDGTGGAFVTGYTRSLDFPTTPGAFDTTANGSDDVFVAALDATGGSLLYATYLGGSESDVGIGIAVDGGGAAFVTGHTWSPDFPATPGASGTTWNGGPDAFVARLDPTGGSLLYATYLGGGVGDRAYDVEVDGAGAAFVAGATSSSDFPATGGAFATAFGGQSDAFVAKLSPSGASLLYATYLGGTLADRGYALALDGGGVATVTGETWSAGFPVTGGAFDTSLDGIFDAFVAKVNDSGSGLLFSTFLGGTAWDEGHAIAVDAGGSAYVAGDGASPNFPTTPGAFQTTYGGGVDDIFVAKLNSNGSALHFATFLGGWTHDEFPAIALDVTGAASVAGRTLSDDFPATLGAFDTTASGNDSFVARLDATGATLLHATFVGEGRQAAQGIAVDGTGAAYATGWTDPTFPATPGSFDPTHNGGRDAFVAKFDMLPSSPGAFVYGFSSPGCSGPLPIGVSSAPQVGNAAFAVTCANAPANSPGTLFLSPASRPPFVVAGVIVWISTSSWLLPLPASSDPAGNAQVAMPIPSAPALAGSRLYAQFVWAGPAAPPPCPASGFSASNALALTLLP